MAYLNKSLLMAGLRARCVARLEEDDPGVVFGSSMDDEARIITIEEMPYHPMTALYDYRARAIEAADNIAQEYMAMITEILRTLF